MLQRLVGKLVEICRFHVSLGAVCCDLSSKSRISIRGGRLIVAIVRHKRCMVKYAACRHLHLPHQLPSVSRKKPW